MHHNLIVDVNNIVFSTKHGRLRPVKSASKKEKFAKESIFIYTLKSILFIARKLKVHSIVLMRDSPNIWRKDIYPDYKANHTDHAEDFYYHDAIEAADMLCDFFRDYTCSWVFSYKRAEADDLIGVWCQESDGVDNTILSSDRDFIQLIDERTKLYSAPQDTFRETEDASYDLFVKCIRGDSGDNIRSAYPKVRETVLKAAWNDSVSMLNLVETTLPDGRKVGHELDRNISLIDLTQQPYHIRTGIENMFKTHIDTTTYSQLKAMKFFVDNSLRESCEVLEGLDRVLKKPPIFKSTK